jgi:subtilisin family serine protease
MKGHLIVALKPGFALAERPHWTAAIRDKSAALAAPTPAIDDLLRRYGVPVWTTREYLPRLRSWSSDEIAAGLDRVYRLILKHARTVPAGLIESIRLLPEVEHARVGQVGSVRLPRAWPQAFAIARPRDDAARAAIHLPQARRVTEGDPDVTVAVLDTGVACAHRELADATDRGADLVHILDGATEFIGDFLDADADPDDDVGHGTHVAGIVAGKGLGMPRGVAPRCRILPVRVLAAMRRGEERIGAGLVENINAGVKWAVDHGADVINMSLGIRHGGGGLPHQDVVDYAERRGVTVVAASGNDGHEELYYPGALPTVIAVGAMGPDGAVSAFSTYGPQVALIAPGEEIYSSHVGDGYAHATGTSHAAPFVAGAAALVQSLAKRRGARLPAREVKRILIETADRVDGRLRDRRAGYGRLNVVDALRLTQARIN